MLALLGDRVPLSLRIFLVSIAIFDDVGAIVIIALFYTSELSLLALAVVAACLPVLVFLNRRGVTEHGPYLFIGVMHTVVAFFILPFFAFANAGIPLGGLSLEQVMHPVTIGIVAGLFLGKQIGVLAACWIAIMLGLAKLPDGVRWIHLYGVALLCGVGFTMSLFIGSLAFENTGVNLLFDERLGIILGSLLAGAAGYCILRLSLLRVG